MQGTLFYLTKILIGPSSYMGGSGLRERFQESAQLIPNHLFAVLGAKKVQY